MIENPEIENSKEFKDLLNDVQSYNFTKNKLETEKNRTDLEGYKKSLYILKERIREDTEPKFRRFLKNKFFSGKSVQEKKKIISDNPWIKKLYPVCDIEKYKVIFLSTKRFISPIDVFYRVPFYAYSDEVLISEAVVFFDEFDATKQFVLSQIVDEGLKSKIDVVKLFLNIHYALQNLTLPKRILHTSDYHKGKVESGEWHSTEDHFSFWKQRFEEKYNKHNINYIIKSVDFEFDKAFLFDDGKYITVIKDSSKKHIYANVDENENILSLRAGSVHADKPMINYIVKDLEFCIDGFAQAMFYVANNFMYSKNEGKAAIETRYTLEEAIYTVLDVLNLGQEEKEYLFNKIQTGKYICMLDEQEDKRRGFNFTEIEDSNYHDMKSVIHDYCFSTTPEDLLIKLAEKALLIGISATAKIETCIGNYDLVYLRKKLGELFIDISDEDATRISDSFYEMINSTKGKYTIHTTVLDQNKLLSYEEKALKMIEQLFEGDDATQYKKILDDKKVKVYYFLIELKLVYLYKEMQQKNIKSAICFLNRFPRTNGDINSDRIYNMFASIDKQLGRTAIATKIVNSSSFDEDFSDVRKLLSEGRQALVITTYQTVGTGKNIQYEIPNGEEHRVVLSPNDTRHMKDFEAIYLCMPTNLLQNLSFDAVNKYEELAKYLFQVEYLYQNKYLSYAQMKINVENGFRQVFFGERINIRYTRNGDFYLHTLKIAMQAVGRICRCRSKNKDIYIYADGDLVEDIQIACFEKMPVLLNEEFRALVDFKLDREDISNELNKYSSRNIAASNHINIAAFTVRQSRTNVDEWIRLRDYVLKFPTCSYVLPQYTSLYYEMPTEVNGYSYKRGRGNQIADLFLDLQHGIEQVSEQACDLPILLSVPCIKKMFETSKYSVRFEKRKYCMTPALFKQVYLGALGEVAGKCILESELGWDVEELDDYSFYEFFDYKIGNIYFDFKHWNDFKVDNDTYVKKVVRKLEKIKGAKCFVINLVKRTDATIKQNMDGTVIQVPYLIDGETGEINNEFLDQISVLINQQK